MKYKWFLSGVNFFKIDGYRVLCFIKKDLVWILLVFGYIQTLCKYAMLKSFLSFSKLKHGYKVTKEHWALKRSFLNWWKTRKWKAFFSKRYKKLDKVRENLILREIVTKTNSFYISKVSFNCRILKINSKYLYGPGESSQIMKNKSTVFLSKFEVRIPEVDLLGFTNICSWYTLNKTKLVN